MSQRRAENGADDTLRRAYDLMRARFGYQAWWPGETPFEVCVGAILTQNTAWTNVEKALANLKHADVMEPRRLHRLPEAELAALIRPAGSFNVKARRLRAFLQVLVGRHGGDLSAFFTGTTGEVRNRLLAIHGIGPETADCLLLYAGGHASFVIDAYTRRIFRRHGWAVSTDPKPHAANPRAEYDHLKAHCEAALRHKADAALRDYWQDFHAQIVAVGKEFCRSRTTDCDACPLKPLLPPGGPHLG